MNAKTVLFCLLVVLLTSCSGTPREATIEVATSTLVSSVTAHLTETSTLTLSPTNTAKPTKYLTVTPAPTAPVQATEQAVIKRYCPLSDSVGNFLFSKSQEWVAFVCYNPSSPDFSFTRITRVNRSENGYRLSFRKDYLEVFEPAQVSPENIGFIQTASDFAALRPVRWTADDKYLFMAFDSPVDGIQYRGSYSLMRIELKTGKITSVLPPSGLYWFDFSKDGTKLFFVDQSKNPMVVKIQNLVTGELLQFPLDEKFNEAGYLMLSPNETKLIVSALSHEKGCSLILLNLLVASQEYLAQDVLYDYFPLSWVDDNTIYGSSSENSKPTYFYIDINTKNTTPAPEPTQLP
ncbi:MAG: hypothetical protein ABI904_12735 [Chloroflexota bacterium]